MSRPSPRVRAVLGTSLLAFVFGYAGVMKVISGPEATYLALVTAGVGDAGVIKATGWLLPIVEMLLAAWLLSGLFPVSACRVCAFVTSSS